MLNEMLIILDFVEFIILFDFLSKLLPLFLPQSYHRVSGELRAASEPGH